MGGTKGNHFDCGNTDRKTNTYAFGCMWILDAK